MYKNKITRALFIGAGLSLALAGCGEKPAEKQAAEPAPAPAPEAKSDSKEPKLAAVQELVRGNGTEVATIDPHKSQGVPESHVIRDLLEGLVNQDANGNT
ncbi:oligopeptide ABC transporter substrate-binding protein OppA, partial [Vibrio alginolyticus]